MNSKQTLLNKNKGFSIVEVAVAMGVVTLMLTTFLGIFGPAQRNVQRALSSKDAAAMRDALTTELAVLRTTDTTYDNAFHKAVDFMIGSQVKDTAVLVYRYKAEPNSTSDSGILPPYTGSDGIPGKDYIVQTAVRKLGLNDTQITAELSTRSIAGPVFVVRMTQLVNDADGVLEQSTDVKSLRNPAIGNPDSDTAQETNYSDYTGAVVPFRAEFYQLPVNQASFVVNGNWMFDFSSGSDENTLGGAVLDVNMAFRR